MTDLADRVRGTIRDVPDFPKEGILFKDITPVLEDAQLFADIIEHFRERYADKNITKILGIESRGFIFGAPLATALGAGLVLVRKPGKLPSETASVSYELEYGSDTLEIHTDSVAPGERVLIIDDLLATGGTAAAVVELAGKLSAEIVEIAFLIELSFLGGADKLGADHYALISY